MDFTLVYDPDCGFCTRSARWIEQRWEPGTGEAVGSWDLDDDALAAMGLDRERVLSEVCLVVHRGDGPEPVGGATAVAQSLYRSRGWTRPAGRLMGLPGIRAVAARAYPVVARHRHRLPGATAACRLDAPHDGRRA